MKRRGCLFVIAACLTTSCGGSSGQPPNPAAPAAMTPGVRGPEPVASPSLVISWTCFTSRVLESRSGCPVAAVDAAGGAATSAPTDLLSSVNGATVTLTWSSGANDPATTNYRVDAGSSPGAANLATLSTARGQTSLTVDSVPAGTYYVRVRAQTASGVSDPSNEVTVIVGGGSTPCSFAPEPPQNVTASVIGSSVTLTWIADRNGCRPTAYAIEVGSAPAAANLATVVTDGPSTTYAATGVSSGTYYIRVRALNGSAASRPSNEIQVVLPAPPECSRLSGGFTIRAGETLRMRFRIAQTGNADLLVATIAGTGHIDGTWALYDGSALLGGDPGSRTIWKTPASAYQFGLAVDFTSISSARIDGRVDLTVRSGSLTTDARIPPNVYLGRATSASSFVAAASVTSLSTELCR